MNISDRVGGNQETRVRGVKESDHVLKKIVDCKERVGSWRTDIKFNQMTEEEFERDHELEVYSHLKKKPIKMYQDIFKEDLEPSDRLDVPPVKIPLKPNHESIPPYNAKVPIPIPRYLDKAAQNELARIIKSGALEEVRHPTHYSLHFLFRSQALLTVTPLFDLSTTFSPSTTLWTQWATPWMGAAISNGA